MCNTLRQVVNVKLVHCCRFAFTVDREKVLEVKQTVLSHCAPFAFKILSIKIIGNR